MYLDWLNWTQQQLKTKFKQPKRASRSFHIYIVSFQILTSFSNEHIPKNEPFSPYSLESYHVGVFRAEEGGYQELDLPLN